MRALFVTPSEVSSGEAITALHMAERVAAAGGEVGFLASPFTAGLLEPHFAGRVVRLTQDGERNRCLWDRTLRACRPDAVVFADYPLLFFSNGSAPLANEAWIAALEELDATIVTLDHLGYAQRAMRLFFGPPHLSLHSEYLAEPPARMHLLLPCPVHEPTPVPARRGEPFRYWEVPLGLEEERREAVRRRYLEGGEGWLVFHSTPNWAWRLAREWGLPYYSYLSRLLEYYLSDLAPVTVVSVNNGELLAPSRQAGVAIHNLGVLPPERYEELLFAADLMLTENAVSATLGKAVCALVPCALLGNGYRLLELLELLERAEEPLRHLLLEMESVRPGAVFPFETFPIWRREDLEELGLFRANRFAEGFARVEIFDGEAARAQLRRLLSDPETRSELRARQQAYLQRLAALPGAEEVLQRIVERERGSRGLYLHRSGEASS